MIVNWHHKQQRASGGPALVVISLMLLLLVQPLVRCDQMRRGAADKRTDLTTAGSSLADFSEEADAMLDGDETDGEESDDFLTDGEESDDYSTDEEESDDDMMDEEKTASARRHGVKGKTGQSLATRFGLMLKGMVAPAQVYYKLIQRYINWFRQYKAFVNGLEDPELRDSFKDPMEVLKEEYARAEGELLNRRCKADVTTTTEAAEPPKSSQRSDKGNSEKAEGMKFVYQTLEEAIDLLEQLLVRLKAAGGEQLVAEEASSVSTVSPVEVDEERVRQAMKRVRTSVINSAKGLVRSELYTVAGIAALNMLATFVAERAAGSDNEALVSVAPLITMLAGSHTSLSMAYFKNLELRAVMSVVDRLNPISLLKCSFSSLAKGGNSSRQSAASTTPPARNLKRARTETQESQSRRQRV